jgi:hypothetical protein
VLVDAVLRSGWSVAALDASLGVRRGSRGHELARIVLRFGDGRVGSVAESLARVVLREIGAPDPVLQQLFTVDGARYFVDFWFPEHGVVVEIDGRAKYSQERFLNGRTPQQVFLDEKRRQASLMTVPGVRNIVRLEWRDLWDVDALIRRLRAAGVPCRRRPVPSAVAVAA